jgi:NADPH-dependent 2,4-dienoyl-CoA reductase/sulfur reductase-like enzyme/peroxiredoxin family protein/rhodanese-related sulfurtransferase/TusA-related sulfurtransferase
MTMEAMKVLIVGGVAGGASAAARLRRLDEKAEIILFEKGEYISYANCGLPYYIGDVIKDKEKLLVQTPEAMRLRFNMDVRTLSEVLSIDRANKTVQVKNHRTGAEYTESYDKLILSPGAEPKRPPMEGIDLPGVYTLRTVPDTYKIRDFVDNKKPKRAVVIGGGFIGVEVAENLMERDVDVTLVEFTDQVVASIDPEMAAFLHQHMRTKGLKLLFHTGATAFVQNDKGGLTVRLTTGQSIDTDLVIFSIGIAPDSRLAKNAGLELGLAGSIKVDRQLRTSDPDIFAVGDAIEVEHLITHNPSLIPLAGPANKQGRIAADNVCGRNVEFEGVQGSAVLKVFDMTAASTGLNEKQLKRDKIDYEKIYIHPLNHAGYYPGGTQMSLKLLFDPASGKILGAQAVGFDGVEKRIDVLATAQRLGATVDDLEKLELTYAPPFSSAKDPVNMLGFTATNIIKGEMKVFQYHDVGSLDLVEDFLIDVRSPEEFELGSIRGAVNIPIDDLRKRLNEVPRGRKIYVFCQVGIRGYLAARILQQNGYSDVFNLTGGYKLYHTVSLDQAAEAPKDFYGPEPVEGEGENLVVAKAKPEVRTAPAQILRVDACGLQCPGPILKVADGVKKIEPGDQLVIEATDPGFASDIGVWCERTGNVLDNIESKAGIITVTLTKHAPREKAPVSATASDKTMVVFSGELDKAIAAFIIATGAASMGRKVTLFFTFWGLNVLRRPEKVAVKKNLVEKMFGMMMPRGSKKLQLSSLSMGGLGTKMMRAVMKSKNVSSLEELIQTALDTGVKLVACQMTMDVMGIHPEELIDGVELGGVATMLGAAELSDTTFFI